MAGHSKWAQIKRTKAVVDAKRGAVFTRIGREITVAARAGADPAGNFQLRTAIAKAKAAGVPAANIERAIAKGSGQGGSGSELESMRYEGYAPGGVAVLVEALSDNRNRTAADLRLTFSKNGGNLGESGCVSYLFDHRSEVRIAAKPHQDGRPLGIQEDALLEGLLELDAEGYQLEGDGQEAVVHGRFEALEALQDGLRDRGWVVLEWEHTWHPLTAAVVDRAETAHQCLKLLEGLEALDDVSSVSTNLEIPESVQASLTSR
ncbi:YebC/PmpR family DNA-binding transcriptional regulator [Synechococcus sp. WH 8101]|uniref:YebC/PmpR family DNA-binding transcriptional regulator n=1 Tax=Synechococcus sp. WH 8101 TaxID=59932 RepID=UPI00102336CD|nr:YebC/PmpR family DNA-binding transcriptional regulator [Synechococcus sp. WH 8101]QBE69891.1 YebC/PmpR family DNA-binding transcriptional regulator [Synechococcus sp. WH 8101]QNI46150.1 putative transcriptional regulator YebC [Synechococcus sp. WH 8101]